MALATSKTLTSLQRKAIDNGIWLCGTCGKLVDSDESDHSVETVREWRAGAELRRYQELLGVADAQEKGRRRLNQFAIVAVDVNGQVVRLSWHGPHDELELLPSRTVSAEELPVIHCTLAKYEPEPVQPRWEFVLDANAMNV